MRLAAQTPGSPPIQAPYFGNSYASMTDLTALLLNGCRSKQFLAADLEESVNTNKLFAGRCAPTTGRSSWNHVKSFPSMMTRMLSQMLAVWLFILPNSAKALQPDTSLRESPTLSRIAQNGKIQIGYVSTPGTFAFQDAQGQTLGYSIDICRRVIESIRLRLDRPDLMVIFLPIRASERIPMLGSGSIDIECGGNTNTRARQKDVDFSYTFFNTGLRLLASKSLKADRIQDLDKKTISVTRGTTAEVRFASLKVEVGLKTHVVGSGEEGLQLLESGKVDAHAEDDVLLYGLLAQSSQKDKLAVKGPFLTVEPYAFMLPKNDLLFRDVVDKTLLQLMHSGEIYTIYRRWFGSENLKIPMSVYMKENIRYPNKYGIP